jgi:predicted O-methyltransferase YrrM
MYQDLTLFLRKALLFLQIFDEAFVTHVRNAIEIGCFHGTSTNLMISVFRQLSPGFENITCMDPWEDTYNEAGNVPWHPDWHQQYQKFLENTKSNADFIRICRGKSQELLPTQPLEPLYDFAYIDGDHTEEGTYIDAMNILPRMRKGGYILFDDYLWGDYIHQPELTPKRAVDRFVEENKDKVHVAFSNYQVLVKVK